MYLSRTLMFTWTLSFSRSQVSPAYVLLAGGTAGIVNWLSCIAQDTVKSRYQTAPSGKYSGLAQVFTEIVSLSTLCTLKYSLRYVHVYVIVL